MGTSARRRGIDSDPERELRFRRIEEELDIRALSNNQTSASAQRRHRSTVPAITGLRLDNQIVGGLGIVWNSSDIPDIRKYELQYSVDGSFLDATTIIRQDPYHTISNLSPETTYHIRVRAFNSRGEEGPWSPVLNSQTGQATVSNLADGSASNIVVRTKTEGFFPAELDGAGTDIGRYLRTRISFPVAAETLIIGVSQGVLDYKKDDFFYIKVKVDGTSKITYTNSNDLGGNTASAGTLTVPGLTVPILLSSGPHEFLIEVEVTGTTTFTPSEMSLAIWQVRK